MALGVAAAFQPQTTAAPRGFYLAIVCGGSGDRPICAIFHATARNEIVTGSTA